MFNDTRSAQHRLPIAFMPAGEHGFGWFGDPQGKLVRPVKTHRVGKRWIECPGSLRERNPTGTYPICDLCILATKDRRLRREPLVLLYGVLIRTSNPSSYWRPGRRPYLMIAPDTLLACLARLLKQGSPQQRKLFYNMVDPRRPGPAIVVQVKKGRYGSVTFSSFTAENLSPVTLGEWYIPLRESWIGEFNHADYAALVAQITRSHPSATDQEHMRTEQEDPDQSDN